MRAREMMARLERLPKLQGDRKTWDLSLLSPEKQDRVTDLFRLLFDSKDLQSEGRHNALAELNELVRNLPLIRPDDPEKGPVIKVPGELTRYWQWKQPASRWRSLNFHKLGKVQTLRFVELCERYGFSASMNTPIKEQMLPLLEWQLKDRVELQGLLDVAAS